MLKTIAWHEFLFTIKRKAWYLVTFGMPLIILAYMGLLAVIVGVSVPGEVAKLSEPIGIVDLPGLLSGDGGPLSDIAFGEIKEIESGSSNNDLIGSVASFLPRHLVMRLENSESAKEMLQTKKLRQIIRDPRGLFGIRELRRLCEQERSVLHDKTRLDHPVDSH